jgi:site-specific DNA-methyltransferase (adenine-specific)
MNSKHKILHGDFVSQMSLIEDESINLILTDIPYNISQKNGLGGHDKKNNRNRVGIDFGDWDYGFDVKTLEVLQKKLKPNGSIVIFSAFEQLHELTEVFNECILKDKLIWEKSNPFVRNRDRRYISNIEFCSWFVKGKKWTFNRQHGTYESSVLKYPSESGGGQIRYHPTQKNLKMMEYLLKIHSNENDLILDPFMGGGTTGVACVKNKRNFIGIEIDESYFQASKKRIELEVSKITPP